MDKQASDFVSQDRLWQLVMDVARYGAIPRGGVNRQALSSEDIAARNHLVDWAGQRGFSVSQDGIGNLFVRREGTDPDLDPVMTGSHLDSQPTGGRFDGAYGVLAGLEVLEALNDGGLSTRRSLEVVAWTNEEGSRYSPGAMGSSIFAGVRDLDSVLDVIDHDGVLLRDALAATLASADIPLREQAASVHAYVEAHIEQGPILEEKSIPIGVVTGIQGIRRLNIDITGDEAHAGTTPRRSRRDAMSAAVAVVGALQQLAEDDDDILRFTVGRFRVSPGSPNTVPGHVHFTIDLRHPDAALLTELGDRIHHVARDMAAPCTAEITDISFVSPTIFPETIVSAVRDSAVAQGLRVWDLPSGAGHDAMHLARICPTGMIFVPCLRGISHNPAESATPEDLAKGTRVLADTLMRLAQD